jgi:hypothetical protein
LDRYLDAAAPGGLPLLLKEQAVETSEKKPEQPQGFESRDAETLIALGLFITALAIPVLLGTFWCERAPQMIVNVISGLVLLGIGVGSLYFGVRNKLRTRHVRG